jgi:DNA end-binding protein Ku
MKQQDRHAFATVSLKGKKDLVLVRPEGELLAMAFLRYAEELKNPAEFKDEVIKVESSPDELKLAKTLVDTLSTKDFDIASYKDDYTAKLTELIEAKVVGEQIVTPPEEEAPQVINLMEALQKSVAAAAAKAGKPARLVAPTTASRAKESRKRKSS